MKPSGVRRGGRSPKRSRIAQLADRQHERVEADLERRAVHVVGDPATGSVAVAAILGPGAREPDEPPVLYAQADRPRQLDDADALLAKGVDLLGSAGIWSTVRR
jgi:hypothetical protein